MTTAPASGTQILDDYHDSDGHPSELDNTQIDELRSLFETSHWHFSFVLCGFQDLYYPLHGPVCELMQRWGQPGYRRLMVQLPRGGLKSSVCTVANALRRKLINPNEPLGIFSLSEDNPEGWIRAIKRLVENNKLIHVLWPHVIPPRIAEGGQPPKGWRWSDSAIDFRRTVGYATPEATIMGMGYKASTAGKHWPEIIKDDILDEEAQNSPTIMENAAQWLMNHSHHLERPASKGSDLIVCTPWRYHDAYYRLLEREAYDPETDSGYRLYRRSALEKNESVFPTMWTRAELMRDYNKDAYEFMCQRMCLPRASREVSFDLEWVRYGSVGARGADPAFVIDHEHYDRTINDADDGDDPPRVVPLAWMDKGLLFDPAPTEATDIRREMGSRNALVMEGIDPWGRRYFLETLALKLDITDVVNELLKMLVRWGAYKVYVEDISFTKWAKGIIYLMARSRDQHVQCIPCPPGKTDKDTRIQARFPDHRRGIYYWNRVGTDVMLEEAMQYAPGNVSSPKDCLDACGYDAKLARPESPNEIRAMIVRDQQRNLHMDGRDPVLGY